MKIIDGMCGARTEARTRDFGVVYGKEERGCRKGKLKEMEKYGGECTVGEEAYSL